MHKRTLAVPAAALVLAVAGVVPAVAHDSHGGGKSTGHTAASTYTKPSHGRAVTFAAVLTGAHEVPDESGAAVNDPDGKAVALVQVKGDRVVFAMQWKGFVPSQGHIHEGAAGQNGDVKVPLFGSTMPESLHSAAGHTTVTDAALAKSIVEHPSGFYMNLHSEEFPGGAVRGQLKQLHKNINPLHIIKGGKLRALANGAQEVANNDATKVNDRDGKAVTFLHPKGTTVDFSLAWVDIKAPSAAHVHKGDFGKNGDVVLGFFDKPVPEGLFAVSGRLHDQKSELVNEIRDNPWGFYSNIHTEEFPDGAVRGQLFH